MVMHCSKSPHLPGRLQQRHTDSKAQDYQKLALAALYAQYSVELYLEFCQDSSNELYIFVKYLEIDFLKSTVNLLGTPVVHNTSKENLLWIIGNVWPQAIYNTAVMTVGTELHLRGGHPRFECT